MLIGFISDTHGLMRTEALAALRGSDMIIHAGDVGRADVLDALNANRADPAVQDNVNTQPWATRLPITETVKAGRLSLLVIHVRGLVSH